MRLTPGALYLRFKELAFPDRRPLPEWAASLRFPKEHTLPTILRQHPNYQSNLVQIARTVSAAADESWIVDVGANIGDTAALLRANVPNRILCIEGSDEYFPFLEANTSSLHGIKRIKCFVDEDTKLFAGRAVALAGTGWLVPDNESPQLQTRTLDDIVKSTWAEVDVCGLIKVDCDGLDFSILRGATKILQLHRPVLFVELAPFWSVGMQLDWYAQLKTLLLSGYQKGIVFDSLGTFMFAFDEARMDSVLEFGRYLSRADRLMSYADIALFPDCQTDSWKRLLLDYSKQ